MDISALKCLDRACKLKCRGSWFSPLGGGGTRRIFRTQKADHARAAKHRTASEGWMKAGRDWKQISDDTDAPSQKSCPQVSGEPHHKQTFLAHRFLPRAAMIQPTRLPKRAAACALGHRTKCLSSAPCDPCCLFRRKGRDVHIFFEVCFEGGEERERAVGGSDAGKTGVHRAARRMRRQLRVPSATGEASRIADGDAPPKKVLADSGMLRREQEAIWNIVLCIQTDKSGTYGVAGGLRTNNIASRGNAWQ